MKILYFLAHPNNIGGAAKVLLNQALIMQCMGHCIKVVIQNDVNGNHSKIYDILCTENQLEHMALQYPISTSIEGIDILGCLDSYDDVLQCVRDFNPDILHSVQLNITVELVSRECKIPHIMNIYPVKEHSFDYEWFDIFPQYHSCDSLFFCKKWENGLDIISRCVRVAYNALPVSTENDCTIKSKYNLICIGTLAAHKNQLEIIKFIEFCKKKGEEVYLNLVGNNQGAYAIKCKEYVISHKLDDYVNFQGEVTHVEAYLQKADALIHASHVESYPGVIVEAMANGIPVLVSPAGGITELVKNEFNGFVIEGHGAMDIYRTFLRFIDYTTCGKINAIITNGIITYNNNHSFESVGKQLLALYEEVFQSGFNPKHKQLDGYEYLKKVFCDFTTECKEYINMDYLASRLWLLYFWNKKIKKSQKTLIWGTGELSEVALAICKLFDLDFKGFVDSHRKGKHLDYPIFYPKSDVLLSVDYILVSASGLSACSEIVKVLKSFDLIQNEDYYLLEDNPCIF
ncbi:glycosyltransferase family 4 protein [Anaerovibrio lipolyticus]|uniref:glycosyltransferase family 4 protein n=1 Tax=Anaerovibrio lipolyticus TaxID=82374 RepID=UPI0004893E49|nr:glycosyltransferase family 4 protein [Anaerovibrio lipolyticus]